MKYNTEDRELENLVDSVDGISADIESIQGLAQVDVTVDKDELPEEVFEQHEMLSTWVKHAVETLIEDKLPIGFHFVLPEANVSKYVGDPNEMTYGMEEQPEEEVTFRVWVKF